MSYHLPLRRVALELQLAVLYLFQVRHIGELEPKAFSYL